MALRVTLFREHEHSAIGKKKNTLFFSIPLSNCSRGLTYAKYIGICSEQKNSTWNQACIRKQLMMIYNNNIISWVKLIATITWRATILIWKQWKWIKQ